MTSLSRSRDENLLVDVEAAIRVAGQQTAITGSAEPLVAALKQSEERLARYNQPRLEGVRRAIARDLDRVRAASVADISTLTIKLDEAIRMVDELALPGSALARSDAGRTSADASPASRGSVPAGAASSALPSWGTSVQETATQVLARAWDEVRSLVRVTRIDHPDAVLLAPEQAFFVKENLKLRLLNARLALLSRQFDTAQSDLQVAQASLDRYFDRSSKRTALAAELIRQVASQAKQGGVPRPDETLAARHRGRCRALAPMRLTIWFVLLFAVAVVAAATLGTNDGLASLYWGGWRIDMSLNLFLLLMVGTCFPLVTLFQAVNALTGLPRRAREWRVARRDRTAQAMLRDALAQYFGGRYSRAQKSAQRASRSRPTRRSWRRTTSSRCCRICWRPAARIGCKTEPRRDLQLKRALDLSRKALPARPAEEGARLLAAEWALDDRDAPRALELLEALPMGVARRTHALRLKLQAAKLGGQPQDALKTARLLVKHQGFSKVAAQGLVRSLASETLAQAHDLDQLRRTWLQFDAADRRDPFVAACAASRAVALGSPEEARAWLRPFWEEIGEFGDDERAVMAEAFAGAVSGLGPDWLPRLEAAALAYPRDGAVALAVGIALVERQLWGKAGACSNRPRPTTVCARRCAARPGSHWRDSQQDESRRGPRRPVLRAAARLPQTPLIYCEAWRL